MPSVMGKRFECSDHGSQYMVTKAGIGELSCVDAGEDGPNQLGKRYQCANCEATLLCTKVGSGAVACDDVPMALLAAKALPSSD